MNPELLAQRLQLTRPLVFLDLESSTAGPEPDPRMDRIVQLAVLKVYTDGKVTQFGTYVNPGKPISPSSTYGDGGRFKGHGITDDMVKDAPPFSKIGRAVAAGLADCDLAGYNVRRYDRPLFVAECTRNRIPYDGKGAALVDPYVLWAKMEPRDLAAWLFRFTGEKNHDSHQAPADVAAVVWGLPFMLDLFPELPTTVAELSALCDRPANPNWIDPEGKFQWVDDVPCLCFTKHAAAGPVPMSQMDAGFYRWILREDFIPEVKALAENAIERRYPTRDGQLSMVPAEDEQPPLFNDLGY